MPNKKTYFLSDWHLVVDNEKSMQREQLICKFLIQIMPQAEKIYILGDIFDFWFEYKKVIPKGFTKLYHTFHTLLEHNVSIEIFTGNHDLWMFQFFEKEFNIKVHHNPITLQIKEHKFMLGHGDGKGPKDIGYKLLKKIFLNSVCIKLFSLLHPDWGYNLAYFWSKKSRDSQVPELALDINNEWLYHYCMRQLQVNPCHFYIFGHRHLPIDVSLNSESKYINLGDWITHFTYAEYDGKEVCLKKWSE